MTPTQTYKELSDKQHVTITEVNSVLRSALTEIRHLRHALVTRDTDNRQLREQVRTLEAELRERGER